MIMPGTFGYFKPEPFEETVSMLDDLVLHQILCIHGPEESGKKRFVRELLSQRSVASQGEGSTVQDKMAFQYTCKPVFGHVRLDCCASVYQAWLEATAFTWDGGGLCSKGEIARLCNAFHLNGITDLALYDIHNWRAPGLNFAIEVNDYARDNNIPFQVIVTTNLSLEMLLSGYKLERSKFLPSVHITHVRQEDIKTVFSQWRLPAEAAWSAAENEIYERTNGNMGLLTVFATSLASLAKKPGAAVSELVGKALSRVYPYAGIGVKRAAKPKPTVRTDRPRKPPVKGKRKRRQKRR